MDISKALALQIGNNVSFPEDRGDPAGYGRITHISRVVNKNYQGQPYIWVTVKPLGGNPAVWPSNRLS